MKTVILGLAAATLIGTAASAQGWSGDYGSWRDQSRYSFRDYPEFRGEISHIRQEIREGVNEGWVDDDQARNLGWQLRQVQRREAQEFRAHGWNLPDDDRGDIRSQLDEIDRAVDEARDNS
jgi:hypothetical protein